MRLLVVVSRDYGELGGAMYFLNAFRASPAPVVMVPAALGLPRLVGSNVEFRSYVELDEIGRVAAEVRPDIVMLFSGYLLPIGSHLSLLKALILPRTLRRGGARIITSDPFLGLLHGPLSLRFSDVFRSGFKRGRVLTAWSLSVLLALSMSIMRRQLRNDLHIYPAAIDVLKPARDHRWLHYFNGAPPPGASETADPRQPPMWLFVLSRVDFGVLRARGAEPFFDDLAARLREAAAFGKRVLMIGCPELVAALRARIAPESPVELREEGTYASYMGNLMAAEYAFFWNYYSFSVLHRVIAGLPVFFFDEGHMVRIFPALRTAGIDVFYGGWKPPLLAADGSLDEASLLRRAAETRSHFERIRSRLETGATPQEVLAGALAR